MILDCHVHISACTPRNGLMSDRLMNSLPFRFMRWKFGLRGADASTERALCQTLADALDATPEIDAAVVLAFDAVYDRDGRRDEARTALHVTNEYVIEVCQRHPKMLFGASVHPYRKDAVAELDRCVAAGAVLMKWLPITQGIDPSDPRCIPFFEALAHHRLPLLSHTGGEKSLPQLAPETADPRLLELALKHGVTVIAAHCGTRSVPGERDYLATFARMAREHERFFGDTSALNLPTRSHAYDLVLRDERVRSKLIHGSDWPIPPLPPVRHLGFPEAIDQMSEPNWLRRDVLIKRKLGFDDAYWRRAATVLRLPISSRPLR